MGNKIKAKESETRIQSKLESDFIFILSQIYKMRQSALKREQILNSSIDNRKKQQINFEILNGIELELVGYTNQNVYGSPAGSVRNSQTFDNISMISDCSNFDVKEMKQSINNLIKYLQDFLPLKMRKKIESIKIKMSDNEDIDANIENMANELQQNKKTKESEIIHYYLNHTMDIFDDFDKLDIKIPLIVSDIPQSIKILLQRLESAQHMNKFFAIV